MRINPAAQSLMAQSIANPPQAQVSDKSGDFGQMLMDALKEVNQTQADSKGLQNDFMAGRPVEYHDLMIAMEKASTSMQLTLQVRNKLLEAYQEISKMAV
jgi:flagellar hook-basal body complex protein FliE